jgi:hypothetical protein
VPTAEWIDLIRSGEFVRAMRSVPFFPLVPKLLSLLFCVTAAAALVYASVEWKYGESQL